MRSLLLLCLLAGCAPPIDDAHQAIVGGVDSTAEDDAVVLLLAHDPAHDTASAPYYLFCTATLVAPNLLLTARHCVSDTTSGAFGCGPDGQPVLGTPTIDADLSPGEMMVFTGAAFPEAATPAAAAALGRQVIHDDATQLCNADLALVVLDRALPQRPAALRLDGPIGEGDAVYAVGWGATEQGPLPPVRQRRDGVTVSTMGPSDVEIFSDMLGDREMRVTESICEGDSGGPVFDATTHAELGVASRGYAGDGQGPGCLGTEHTVMRVPAFKDLVLRGFAAAGATPIAEMTASPDLGQAAPPAGGGCAMGGGAGPSGCWLALALLAVVRRRRSASPE